MQDAFDVIVVGGGIIGRLTAWLLGRSGKNTLLLEQYRIDQTRGSSRGKSRMFGEAHARDIYFWLARQSRYLWQELERETGEKLLHLYGGFDISASADSQSSIKEISSTLRSRRLSFEIFDGATLCRRYPQWRCNLNVRAIYSEQAGILDAEHCMNAAIRASKNHKVLIKEQSRVVGIYPSDSRTTVVKTSSGKVYRTQNLIIAAGPWAKNILRSLGITLPLRVSQEQTVYFTPRCNAELFTPKNFPVWEWEGSEFVYGFPIFEKEGIKIAFHSNGWYLKNLGEFRRTPREDVNERLRLFLNKHIPDAAGEAFGASTCMYTNTPDDDFVIDVIPGYPNIAYFTGDSGHAFNCAPAVAETLVQLVCEGKTSIDISCFSAKRF